MTAGSSAPVTHENRFGGAGRGAPLPCSMTPPAVGWKGSIGGTSPGDHGRLGEAGEAMLAGAARRQRHLHPGAASRWSSENASPARCGPARRGYGRAGSARLRAGVLERLAEALDVESGSLQRRPAVRLAERPEGVARHRLGAADQLEVIGDHPVGLEP